MTVYLDLEDALEQVAFLGFMVKDVGLLDSALARPRTSLFGEDVYPDLPTKAAAMMHSLIKNQPLIDGNKRTGWLLFVTFIATNGHQHDMTSDEAFDLTIGLATDVLTIEAAAKIISKHLVLRTS
ncbi:MAG: type II toxin-antitoxin system death-on-curing family toxin [Aquiluna sp.]|nr:type II toxin-antitoxin system death-on-curing family toxin [Aquiluna sp.]